MEIADSKQVKSTVEPKGGHSTLPKNSHGSLLSHVLSTQSMNQRQAKSVISHSPKNEPQSRDMVRWFLSAMSPQSSMPKMGLSRELSALNRAVNAIVLATDEEVITSEEAEAVIKFITERFIGRQIDQVFLHATCPRQGSWFITRSQSDTDK